MKRFMQRLPGVRRIYRRLVAWRMRRRFSDAADYWEHRYHTGGTSGSGSYGPLAQFKARVLNEFVERHQVTSVIEFGCGDGNQLLYAVYPSYIGLDVSPQTIRNCMEKFQDDPTKSFFLYRSDCFVDNAGLFSADLALSLDVLFHLVEDSVFERYLVHLFAAAERFVIIYASDRHMATDSPYERHRKFTDHVATRFPEWVLLQKIENEYPWSKSAPTEGSLSDFYIYARKPAG